MFEVQNTDPQSIYFVRRNWEWLTAREGYVKPSDMPTRHLFYTFRMIWNHRMPREFNVGQNVKRYRFNPHTHPDVYLMQAVRALGAELHKRDDLLDWQKHELSEMARHYAEMHGKVAPPVLQIDHASEFEGVDCE